MRLSSCITALLAATVFAAPIEDISTTHSRSKRQFKLLGYEFDPRIQWSDLLRKPSLIPNFLPLIRAKYNKAERHFSGTPEARGYSILKREDQY